MNSDLASCVHSKEVHMIFAELQFGAVIQCARL